MYHWVEVVEVTYVLNLHALHSYSPPLPLFLFFSQVSVTASQSENIKWEIPEINISFKLCAILSSMIKSLRVPLHPLRL